MGEIEFLRENNCNIKREREGEREGEKYFMIISKI
jgi:hypothetical protein